MWMGLLSLFMLLFTQMSAHAAPSTDSGAVSDSGADTASPGLSGPATVERIEVMDRDGDWQPIDFSDDVFVGGERRVLRLGDQIPMGTEVTTGEVRITLRWSDGDSALLYEDATMTAQPYGIEHTFGHIYYEVRGFFRVRYLTTEAVVAGTKFSLVGIGESATVEVFEGKVIVENPLGTVTLTRGERSLSEPGQPPREFSREAWWQPQDATNSKRQWFTGGNTQAATRVGVQVGAGVGAQGSSAERTLQGRTDLTLRRRLVAPISLAMDVGLVVQPSGGYRFPTSFGAELGLGAFSVTLQPTINIWRVEAGTACFPDQLPWKAQMGATYSLGYRVAPLRNLGLEGRLIGSWASDNRSDNTGLATGMSVGGFFQF